MSVTFYVALFLSALAPTVVFAFWLRKQSWERGDKISAWDPFIKLMAIAGAIIAGLASFERFLDQRQQVIVQGMAERDKPRQTAFFQARQVASHIAIAKELTSEDTIKDVNSFWRLYWGELASVEGRDVELAMVNFGNALRQWQSSGVKPSNIEGLSLAIAHATRKEMEDFQKRIDVMSNRYSVFLR